ncbi:unnamed protein product [Arabis nemorensis]|uniref:Uncharacterized protein n=1 Tax=Arabis nemorensis TaxID=586526 RepID=A0A565BGX9_9BRAS|nr:unnamed protein product [Arabis nemorensis]
MTTEEYITTVEGKECITTEKIFQWQSDYWSGVVESEVIFFNLLNSPLLRYVGLLLTTKINPNPKIT